jgi:hypothetical protein
MGVQAVRLVVLLLSLGTLVLYGRAIAGLWGHMIGHPRPGMIIYGLIGGTVTSVLALLLWRKRIKELDWISEEEDRRS